MRVTQKPFRMAEGSLSSFAAIKLIYVKINGYPLENKEDNRCFYGKCLFVFKVRNKKIINHLPYEYKDNI